MPRIADALERESQSVDLEQGDFERLLGRRERKQRNRRLRAGAVGVIVALAVAAALARSFTSTGVPADRGEPGPVPAGVSGALAFAVDGDGYIADPDGSRPVQIEGASVAGCTGSAYSAPEWSPDGTYLALVHGCGSSSDPSTVVITYADGTIVAEIPAAGFGWSPESTRIAVWGDGQRTLDVFGLDGVRQVALPSPFTGTAAENAPTWTPDGSALLVYGARPRSLMAVPLDGSPAYELPYGLRLPSPDGTRIALQGDHGTVFVDADGAQVSKVDRSLFGGVWSPDGTRFASVSDRGELVVVDVASGDVTLLPMAGAASSNIERVNVVRGFSPQGDRLLFAALVRSSGGGVYNSLYSIGVDGSDPRLLVDGAMQGQWRPR